jgi:transposase-like protein
MARRTLSNEVKQGILDGLKNGSRPADLAAQFGVSIPTIYNYRKSQLDSTVATSIASGETATATLAPVATRSARKSVKASR